MSNPYVIVEGDLTSSGRYRVVMRDGHPIVKLTCPGCGVQGSLCDHAIDGDGIVAPSLVCPNSCGFHKYVRLDRWRHGKKMG